MTTTEIAISEHLDKLSPDVRAIVEAARQAVAAVAPTAREVTYDSKPPSNRGAMWKITRYAAGDEWVVGIGTYPAYAVMFFYRGRELDGGRGLLEGGGKDMRFTRLKAPADADRAETRSLLRAGFEMASLAS